MNNFILSLTSIFLFLSVPVKASLQVNEPTKTEVSLQEQTQIDSLIQQSNHYLKNDLKKSLLYALKSFEVSYKQENKNNQILAYSQLGKVYYYIGMYDKCYLNWQKARELSVEISDEIKISTTTFNLVALLIVLKDYDKAEHYLHQVKPFYFSKEAPEFLTKQLNVINNEAIIYKNKGLINEAQESFEEGIIIFNQLEDKTSNLSFLNAYVHFLIEQKKFPLAIELLNQLTQLNNEGNYYNAQIDATIHLRFAIIYNALNTKEKLKYHLNKGIEIAKSINSITLQKEFNFLSYKIHKAEENTEKALLFKENYDSLFQLEQVNESKLAIIHDEFEEELIKFQERFEDETLEFNKQKKIIYSTTLIIILFLVYYFITKFKKEQTKKIKSINQLEKKIETKEKDIITLELKHIQQNTFFEKIITDIKSNTLQKKALLNNKTKSKALSKESQTLWNEFELRFNQVENDFYIRLEKISQELTKNERRLCALLRLDFSTKEIAHINNQSVRSIEIARTRIRKKLNLTNTNIKLNTFLKQL